MKKIVVCDKILKKVVAFLKYVCYYILARGSDSVVECHLAKVEVAGPNPVSRSIRGNPMRL